MQRFIVITQDGEAHDIDAPSILEAILVVLAGTSYEAIDVAGVVYVNQAL